MKETGRFSYITRMHGLLMLVLVALLSLGAAGCDEAQGKDAPATATPPQDALVRARNFSGGNADWEPVVWEANGEMVLVPAGCFMMGSTPEQLDAVYETCAGWCEREWFDHESPQHRVCFDDPFWIGRYEVTNAQFAAFLNAEGVLRQNGEDWPSADSEDVRIHQQDGSWVADEGYENHPVVGVTWYNAQAYAEWRGCSLPTEAQWEYAARGPDALIFPWGDELIDDKLVFERNPDGPDPVDSKPNGASWVGALSMGDNVSEWVADWYDEFYYSSLNDGVVNPPGPAKGYQRVLRGGDWRGGAQYSLRTAYRAPLDGAREVNENGLRMVCPVP